MKKPRTPMREEQNRNVSTPRETLGIGESNLTFDKDFTSAPAVRNKYVREEYEDQGKYVKVEKQTTVKSKRKKASTAASKYEMGAELSPMARVISERRESKYQGRGSKK